MLSKITTLINLPVRVVISSFAISLFLILASPDTLQKLGISETVETHRTMVGGILLISAGLLISHFIQLIVSIEDKRANTSSESKQREQSLLTILSHEKRFLQRMLQNEQNSIFIKTVSDENIQGFRLTSIAADLSDKEIIYKRGGSISSGVHYSISDWAIEQINQERSILN